MGLLEKIISDVKQDSIAKIKTILANNSLGFQEADSRTLYGYIGHVYDSKEVKLGIYPECFYVHDKGFPMNVHTLELVGLIQSVYLNVTRDEKGKICPVNFPVSNDLVLDCPLCNNHLTQLIEDSECIRECEGCGAEWEQDSGTITLNPKDL